MIKLLPAQRVLARVSVDDLGVVGHDILVHHVPDTDDDHVPDTLDHPDPPDTVDQDDLGIVGVDQLLLDQTQSLYHCDGPNPGPGQCLSQQCQQHHPVYILVQHSSFLQEQQ